MRGLSSRQLLYSAVIGNALHGRRDKLRECNLHRNIFVAMPGNNGGTRTYFTSPVTRWGPFLKCRIRSYRPVTVYFNTLRTTAFESFRLKSAEAKRNHIDFGHVNTKIWAVRNHASSGKEAL